MNIIALLQQFPAYAQQIPVYAQRAYEFAKVSSGPVVELAKQLNEQGIITLAKEGFTGVSHFFQLVKKNVRQPKKFARSVSQHFSENYSPKRASVSHAGTDEEVDRIQSFAQVFFILQPVFRALPYLSFSPFGFGTGVLLANACGFLSCALAAKVEVIRFDQGASLETLSNRFKILGYGGGAISFSSLILSSFSGASATRFFIHSAAYTGSMSGVMYAAGYSADLYQSREAIHAGWKKVAHKVNEVTTNSKNATLFYSNKGKEAIRDSKPYQTLSEQAHQIATRCFEYTQTTKKTFLTFTTQTQNTAVRTKRYFESFLKNGREQDL